jgi:hypothetical protein
MRKNRTWTRHLLTWLLGIALVAASGVKAQGLVTPSSVTILTISPQSNKPSTDINWSLVISIVALVVSFVFGWRNLRLSKKVAQLTTLSPADIKFLLAKVGFCYFVFGTENSTRQVTFGFVVPMTFYNLGAQSGIVYKVLISITKDNREYFNIPWTDFTNYENGFLANDVAQPILVLGKTSKNVYIRFELDPKYTNNNNFLPINDKNYTLILKVWTKLEFEQSAQLKKTIVFKFPQEAITMYQNNRTPENYYKIEMDQSNLDGGPRSQVDFQASIKDAKEI